MLAGLVPGKQTVMTQKDLNSFLQDFQNLPRSTPLSQEPGLRILLLHVKQGEQIPQHHAPGAITVHCLAGSIHFYACDNVAELSPGKLVHLPPQQPHRLEAQAESLLLVTLASPQSN